MSLCISSALQKRTALRSCRWVGCCCKCGKCNNKIKEIFTSFAAAKRIANTACPQIVFGRVYNSLRSMDAGRDSLPLTAITKTPNYRTYQNIDQLNITADYIKSVFSKYSDSVFFQEYSVNGNIYKNVIASFGTENKTRIIVGAHYDVCNNQEGADDNASGVVGLLEISRLLHGKKLNKRIDLVAYTLEEPPYFRTNFMGSYIHAKMLFESNTPIYGMISVEMIGFFTDEKYSQSYPLKWLSLIYGNKGNYITLVKKFGAGKFARKFCHKYKSTQAIKSKIFTATPSLPGIDFSDHLNYWNFKYSAIMITDTAFLRNNNYHLNTDIMETLDLKKMAKVIGGIYNTLLQL